MIRIYYTVSATIDSSFVFNHDQKLSLVFFLSRSKSFHSKNVFNASRCFENFDAYSYGSDGFFNTLKEAFFLYQVRYGKNA